MFRISKNYCEILSLVNHSEISGFEPKNLEKELYKFINLFLKVIILIFILFVITFKPLRYYDKANSLFFY